MLAAFWATEQTSQAHSLPFTSRGGMWYPLKTAQGQETGRKLTEVLGTAGNFVRGGGWWCLLCRVKTGFPVLREGGSVQREYPVTCSQAGVKNTKKKKKTHGSAVVF